MVAQNTSKQPNGMVVLVSALMSAVSAIWGYEFIACNGLIAGALSTLMRAGFLVFVHLPTLAGCVGLVAFFGLTSYWLVGRRMLRDRQELLTIALPVIAFSAGIAVGMLSSGVECALHPWA